MLMFMFFVFLNWLVVEVKLVSVCVGGRVVWFGICD